MAVGGATEDIAFYTDQGVVLANRRDVLKQQLLAFEDGSKINIDQAYFNFGGGAANVVVNLAGLGFKVGVITSVGADERGAKIKKNLKTKKVKGAWLRVSKKNLSGFSLVILNRHRERLIFSYRGANDDLEVTASDRRILKKAKWLYITSLSGTAWKNNLDNLFKSSRQIIWNPGHVQLNAPFKSLKTYLVRTNILCLNKDEALELAKDAGALKGKNLAWANNIKNLLTVIKKFGPRLVVITSGAKGVDVYDGQKFYHQSIIKGKKKLDVTGVGDAFHSTFWAGLQIYKGDIQKAMKLGILNTASLVSEIGAQNGLLTKKDLKV